MLPNASSLYSPWRKNRLSISMFALLLFSFRSWTITIERKFAVNTMSKMYWITPFNFKQHLVTMNSIHCILIAQQLSKISTELESIKLSDYFQEVLTVFCLFIYSIFSEAEREKNGKRGKLTDMDGTASETSKSVSKNCHIQNNDRKKNNNHLFWSFFPYVLFSLTQIAPSISNISIGTIIQLKD